MRASPGMTFTCEPPWVMIGCTRMLSSSRNVSRIALIAGQRDLRGVEGVDAEMRRPAGVARAPDEAGQLADAAVVRQRHAGLAVLGVGRRVDHHGEVHVVEVAEADQLGLAAEQLERPGLALGPAPLEVAALLGGHREERHPSREMGEGAGVVEPHGGAEKSRHLGVVAAGVGRARVRIGLRVPGHDQRVELADQGERRARARLTRHVGAHAGERQSRAGREAEAAEAVLHQLRRLGLLEAELGVAADLLADADDLVGPPVDRRRDPALQLGSRHQ